MNATKVKKVQVDADWLSRLDRCLAIAVQHLVQARKLLEQTGKYREEHERGKKEVAHEHVKRALEALGQASLPF